MPNHSRCLIAGIFLLSAIAAHSQDSLPWENLRLRSVSIVDRPVAGKVIRRDLKEILGENYSIKELIKSQHELANLNYFDSIPSAPEYIAYDYSTSQSCELYVHGTVVKKEPSINCRETNAVNLPDVADAYPFISGDGLRLYFTSNREGGHGRFFISTRKSIRDPFGEPVVLSKTLDDGFYAGTLTADELTMCMVRTGEMYIAKRKDRQSEFGEPVLLKGMTEDFHYGPSISPDGNTIIVTVTVNNTDVFKIYKKTGEYEFAEAGLLDMPKGVDVGPGQFGKDGLSFYFSIEDETVNKEAAIWRMTRQSLTGRFSGWEKLPLKVNVYKRNFQPSVNDDATIIAYVTSQTDSWSQDEIVLAANETSSSDPPGADAKEMAGKTDSRGITFAGNAKVFPNPFGGNIIIEIKEEPAPGTRFFLYEGSGKIIREELITNRRSTITTGNLAAGLYFYQLRNGQKKVLYSGKLIRE